MFVLNVNKGGTHIVMNDTEIISSLKKIVDSVGVEAFANHARANALVSDYFPGYENEKTRNLIKSIINIDAFIKISSATNNNLDEVCKKLKTYLVNNAVLSEDCAKIVVGWVCSALGKRKPNFSNIAQLKPQTPSTTSSNTPNSARSSSNSSYTPTRQVTQQPRTVNASTTNTYGLNLNYHIKHKKKSTKNTNSHISSILLRTFFAIIMFCEMLGSVYLTPILLNYSGTILNIVQCGNILLILVFSSKIIVQRYSNSSTYVVHKSLTYIIRPLTYFIFSILISAALVVLSALIVRSFVYLCGDIWAIINYCILVVATIVPPISFYCFGFDFDSCSGFWEDISHQLWGMFFYFCFVGLSYPAIALFLFCKYLAGL